MNLFVSLRLYRYFIIIHGKNQTAKFTSWKKSLPSQHFARRALRLLSFSLHSDEKKCPLIWQPPFSRGRIPITFLWFPRESMWMKAWLLEVSSTVSGFFHLHKICFLWVGATFTKSDNRTYIMKGNHWSDDSCYDNC